MDYKHITYEQKEKIGIVTLHNPEKHNVLTLDLINEFCACLRHVAQEGAVKVIILKGAGKNFSAGHDLNEILGHDINDIRQLFQACLDLMMVIHAVPQAVIAQVHGIATAAGCQLVAACDLVVSEEGAQFATPGVQIGLFCSTPMVPLSRAVGRKKSLEMLLTGKLISAQEAKEYNLVNRVVPKENLEKETWALASEIAQYSLAVLGLGKQAFYQQIDMEEKLAYQYATEVISANALMADAAEGISAFFEKRSPIWKEK